MATISGVEPAGSALEVGTSGPVGAALVRAGRGCVSPRRPLRRWAAPGLDLVAATTCSVAVAAATGMAPAVAMVVAAMWLALLHLGGDDPHPMLARREHRAARVLVTGARLGLVCWVAQAFGLLSGASPGQLLVLVAILTGATVAARDGASARLVPRARVLVVGHDEQVAGVVTELARGLRRPFEVSGVCLVDPASDAGFDVPVGRGVERLAATVEECAAEAVLVLPHDRLHSRTLQRIGWQLEQSGVHLFVGTGLLDVSRSRTRMTDAGGLRLLHVRSSTHHGPARLVKDAWERAAAGTALLLLGPLLLVLALAVRRDSPGPALFRQERVGRDGRVFTMVKLRTMAVDAAGGLGDLDGGHDVNAVLFKLRADPRVTAVGAVLRRWSLDELPQLLNVVRGDMSLVGPRPALPTEVARYDGDPQRRLAVKPGLSGLWQVSGRSDLSWEDTVRLDLLYVDNWSLGLDLVILLRTVGAVLRRRGAY